MLQPNSIRQLVCPFDFAPDHRSSMSDSHEKRPRDDNDLPNDRAIIADTSAGDIHWPCSFCGNHCTGSHDWKSSWKGWGRACLCVKCQNKWKYGEKVANVMHKKDDTKDDKKDDMDKKDESKIVDGNVEPMIVDG